jgi:hypothetical protein
MKNFDFDAAVATADAARAAAIESALLPIAAVMVQCREQRDVP